MIFHNYLLSHYFILQRVFLRSFVKGGRNKNSFIFQHLNSLESIFYSMIIRSNDQNFTNESSKKEKKKKVDTTKIETSVLLDDYSLIKGSKRVANFLTSLRGFPWRWNDPPVTTVDLQSKSLADARTGNDFRTNNSSEELIYRVSWERGKIPSR